MNISFRGDVWEVRPRRLWQALFNLYRENNCDLGYMDNLLIDLGCCTKAFDMLHEQGTVRFMWGCCPKYWATTWRFESDYCEGSAELTALLSHCDALCFVELTQNEATITKFSPKQEQQHDPLAR